MQISEEILEKIKSQNDIVEVISEYVTLKKNGRNFIGWDHRLALDVQYVKKITFIGDLRIILQTALKFIKKEDIAVDTNKVESNFAEERRSKMQVK